MQAKEPYYRVTEADLLLLAYPRTHGTMRAARVSTMPRVGDDCRVQNACQKNPDLQAKICPIMEFEECQN